MNEVIGEVALVRSKTRELYKAFIHKDIDTTLYDKLADKLHEIDNIYSEIITKLEEEVK
jgi:hypothetical protein